MASGKLVFFGTAETAVPFLAGLRDDYEIALVVTQPDSCGGRDRRPLESPVKRYAREQTLPLLQPPSLKTPGFHARLGGLAPDFGVVVAYGQWLPAAVRDLPAFGTLNVHFSLLPRFRGAAPVQRALQAGETRTGITVFEICREMDAGDIWAQRQVDIGPTETAAELLGRLSRLGAPFLRETLARIRSGELAKTPQDHRQASAAPALRKEEGAIDWRLSAREIYNRFRAFQPWPGLRFSMAGRPVRITAASLASEASSASGTDLPGQIVSLDRRALAVRCGDGAVLEILAIQPPGKRPMTPHDYSLGNRFPPVLA